METNTKLTLKNDKTIDKMVATIADVTLCVEYNTLGKISPVIIE